ncbi:MAG: hypothetical protein AN484_27880, partial [Aphanizomenon flos-aquae WA102]
NFPSLAGEALSGPGSDLSSQSSPHKPGGYEAFGGPAARMAHTMELVKQRPAKTDRNQRAKSSGGAVTVKQPCPSWDRGDVQCLRGAQGGNLRAQNLGGRHLLVREGRLERSRGGQRGDGRAEGLVRRGRRRWRLRTPRRVMTRAPRRVMTQNDGGRAGTGGVTGCERASATTLSRPGR